jgi:hypothetical protein
MNHEAINNVRRRINEVLKKDEARIVVGWRPGAEPVREEGEVWEDNAGKTWTIKNGIKQTVTKLDDAKTPWWCPKCSKPLNHRLDLKFWRIRGHCLDCHINAEAEIRKQGPEAWANYEKNVMLRNFIAALKDQIQELQAYHDTLSKPEYIIADEYEKKILMFEKWDIDIDSVKADIRRDIEIMQKKLDETIAEHGTGEE